MSSDSREGGPLLGSLLPDEGTVRMTDRVDAPVGAVWSALTEAEQLAMWLGEAEGDLRLGGTFRARFFASGWEGTGRIEVCEPRRRLVVLTKDADDPDAPDEHVIEVTLAGDGDHTTVVWEERPIPVDLLAPYGAGIQVHVEDLAAHLAGRPRCDANARFATLLPAYQERVAER